MERKGLGEYMKANTKELVLEELYRHTDQLVSGEELAKACGISRTAIWKIINDCRKEGYSIESVPNKGYRFQDSDLLSSAGLRHHLPASLAEKVELEVVAELASTNQECKLQAADPATPRPKCLLTERQIATKGRFNRAYFADEKGRGIYFSLLVNPADYAADIRFYTVLAAVACQSVFSNVLGRPTEIKWVNDLYVNQRKVCGILSEAVSDLETQTISSVIIGMGINFTIPQEEFPAEIQSKAGSLFPEGHSPFTRNQVVAAILTKLFDLLENFDQAAILTAYRQHSFVLGKEIHFSYKGQEHQATAIAINDDAELVVRFPNQQQQVLKSGEISILQIDQQKLR